MNIDLIRQDTRGCSDKLFFNSAGASLMPQTVVKAMAEHLQLEEQLGGYEAARRKSETADRLYQEIARLINCKPSNIAFTNNATDAYARALSSIPLERGDCIITTSDDYVSNQIAFISLQKRLKIEVIRIKNLPDNDLDLEDLVSLIKKHHPKLVAVTHIPTNSGLIQNVAGVGKICRQYDVLYLVDACQSIGQLPVDVNEIGCDFLTAAGRKFLRGPRGTGFLYVSDRVLEEGLVPLFIDMRGANWTGFDDYAISKTAQRFEHWEHSHISLAGLAEAARYANDIGLHHIASYNKLLADTLRYDLSQSKEIRVLDRGNQLSSIVTFCKKGGDINAIQKVLTENNVYYSVSYKHFALIDFTHKNVDAAVRLSPHYFNTPEEIEKVTQVLVKS